MLLVRMWGLTGSLSSLQFGFIKSIFTLETMETERVEL